MTAAIMNKTTQEDLYNEIVAMYDFGKDIVSAIEQEEKNQNIKLSLASPVIEQLDESTQILADEYLAWIKSGQMANEASVKKSEKAVRMYYAAATNFIETLKKLPAEVAEKSKEKASEAVDNIKESKILANIVTENPQPGDIIQGGMWQGFEELRKKLPSFEKLILAVRATTIHLCRVMYYFVGLKQSILQNASNMLWGRVKPDLYAQAILERAKAVGDKAINEANPAIAR